MLTTPLPGRRPLLLGAALLALHAPLAAAQETVADRQRERAEQRFASVLAARDAAYLQLVAEYDAAAAWYGAADAAAGPPPEVWAQWFAERAVAAEERLPSRARGGEPLPFHELWNDALYRSSPAARRYAEQARALEKAFHAREKARHPERYTRAYDRTPPGMALIPGGKYTLGPGSGYLLGYPEAQKERNVTLKSFYLDRDEVNCAEYARFLLAQPPALREEHLPANWSWSSDGAPLFPDGAAQQPVVGVSWASAHSYAEWAGKRLPSEAEWEAAAAGLERRRYPLGERFDAAKINCLAHGAGGPLPAASLAEDATPQGVRCLSGNVREWTADLYVEQAGANQAKAQREADENSLAVVRGGSYSDEPEACLSSYRWLYPAVGARYLHVGFRCAKDLR